ncbi:hypothetical protein [Lentzea sp. CA-135723]|uniref:hypothetical protein n=1 Tax=Lentzea sp. CA-135723 TaxID=3239950 RepID=UPI003D8F04DF
MRDGETGKGIELLRRLRNDIIMKNDGVAAKLADLLADDGDWPAALGILRGGGNSWAREWLAKRFAAAGRLDRLRDLAEVGDGRMVSMILVEALLRHDQVTEALELFRRIENRGDPTGQLLESLVRHGEPELAIEAVTERHSASLDDSLHKLAAALCAHGYRNLLISLLREYAAAERRGSVFDRSPDVLAQLLADHDCWPEVLKLARKNPKWALKWIPRRLAMAGNIAQLRKLFDQGHEHAGREYVRLLARTRRMPEALDVARTAADAGLDWANDELATCLAEFGGFDELAARAAGGNRHAARRLVILARLGKLPNSADLLRHGLASDGSRVTDRGQSAHGPSWTASQLLSSDFPGATGPAG